MNYGGDSADQIVRYSLEGIDYSLRLSGTVAKNLAIFFAAVLKDQKRTYGKTRMVRMLKENRPLKFFTVPSVRAELDKIRQEKQESAKQKEQNRSRSKNRSAGRKKRKKSKAKGR